MLLRDKVAIVTGAARGIGRAIALSLAEEGAHVAFNFVKSEDKAQELKGRIEAMGRKALMFRQDVKAWAIYL